MAISTNINKRSNKNPRQKMQDSKAPTYGIYMAEVISTKDISRTGRLEVFVPALAQDKETKTGYFYAVWSSPFAGSTNPTKFGKEVEKPEQTISSYGMWMVPPDIGNFVLIAFGDGNMKYPIVISCLYADKFNHMVPGMPAGKNFQVNSSPMPTMEKNKKSKELLNNDATRPIQHTISEAIVKQGLMYDPIRGVTTSGARRESPSEVFGFLTPGPRDPKNFNYRLGGHSFVMDDNMDSRNIRIRTAQGNQILLDDNEGMIYFINKSGKVWMEFSENGAMQLYAENGIHLRTKGDFNLRADKNVNIEAGQDVNIKAAGDTAAGGYAGPGTFGAAPTGVGGNLNLESQLETRIASSASIYQTSASGDMHINVAGVLNGTASGDINLKTPSSIFEQAGGDINDKAGGNINSQAGGNIVEVASKVLMNSGGNAASAEDATSIVGINTQDFNDQPNSEIPYDKDAENVIPTGGVRIGDVPAVKTIVNDYVTAEPWEGHGISNPTNQDNPASIQPNAALVNSTPVGASGLTGQNNQPVPASNNTPAGYSPGVNFDGLNKPMYGPERPANSNFNFAQKKELNKTLAAANTVHALASSLPPVRSPTLSAKNSAERVLGSTRRLSDLEAKQGLLASDAAGRRVEATGGAVSRMASAIKQLKANPPSDFNETVSYLNSLGISVSEEGGVRVYTDPAGNQIRDISDGLLSTEANFNITQQDFLTTQDLIRPIMPDVPVSDNQFAAFTSLAMNIGVENLSNSIALNTLASGDYVQVPRALLEFSYDNNGQFRQDYYQRRLFEGELFQTPDFIPLPNYGFSSVPWQQQARDLRNIRELTMQGING